MKALIKSRTVVDVNVLARKKRGWLFPKDYILVEYMHYTVNDDGKINYSNRKAEWVLAENVFDE